MDFEINALLYKRGGGLMISKEELQTFQKEGYFIIDNFFSSQMLNHLEQNIDTYIESFGVPYPETGLMGISNLQIQSKIIESFITDKKLVKLVTRLIGHQIKVLWSLSLYKKPGGKADFTWHQDNSYVEIEPKEYITCYVPISNISEKNGCLWVLPGSHKQGLLKHNQTKCGNQCYFGTDKGKPLPLKKGSILFFSSLLIHRSSPNISETTRKAFSINYSSVHAVNTPTGENLNNGPKISSL